MLITKQKREPRRARQHTAWLTFDDDFVSHECQVLDVSLNGAKLVAEVAVEIGSRFRLSTVPHALESISRSRLPVSRMPEEISTFLSFEGAGNQADSATKSFDCALGGLAQL